MTREPSLRVEQSSEPSLNPNKSSGDIVERLKAAHANSQQRIVGSNIFAESAAEIERLRRELEQERGTFARHEQTLRDNGIASHAEAIVRVHAAESAVAAAWEEAAKIADRYVRTGEFTASYIASAIRAASSDKTAQSNHSPSTLNTRTE